MNGCPCVNGCPYVIGHPVAADKIAVRADRSRSICISCRCDIVKVNRVCVATTECPNIVAPIYVGVTERPERIYDGPISIQTPNKPPSLRSASGQSGRLVVRGSQSEWPVSPSIKGHVGSLIKSKSFDLQLGYLIPLVLGHPVFIWLESLVKNTD